MFKKAVSSNTITISWNLNSFALSVTAMPWCMQTDLDESPNWFLFCFVGERETWSNCWVHGGHRVSQAQFLWQSRAGIMKLVHLPVTFINSLILTLSFLINCYTFNIIEFRATKHTGPGQESITRRRWWYHQQGEIAISGSVCCAVCWSESFNVFPAFQELHAMIFTVTDFVDMQLVPSWPCSVSSRVRQDNHNSYLK